MKRRRYMSTALLVIDELGFEPMMRQKASLFFWLITYRYGCGAILLTTNGFLEYARFATTDCVLAFFSYLAIYAYLRARDGHQSWWVLVGMGLGLAVMTKSAGAWLAPR